MRGEGARRRRRSERRRCRKDRAVVVDEAAAAFAAELVFRAQDAALDGTERETEAEAIAARVGVGRIADGCVVGVVSVEIGEGIATGDADLRALQADGKFRGED